MPKAQGKKYYAVLIGRSGPQVYTTWDECRQKVSRYPGAVHKSFKSRIEAEDWLGVQRQTHPQPLVPPAPLLVDTSSSGWKQAKLLVIAEEHGLTEKPVVRLSQEQQSVLDAVQKGGNVFFTGSAGTGKSVLLREIIDFCGGRDSREVAITATTGIAAVNIGGCTLHSWAGIGVEPNEPAKKFAGKCIGHPFFRSVLDRWKTVKTLIIDEISMLDGKLFDKLEAIAQILRRSERPFGGIQLVLCGDFCQLPPISGKDVDLDGNAILATFAFEAKQWSACVGLPMMLTKVFRQKDQEFVDMLNEMRFGNMSEETILALKKLDRAVKYTDGIEPSELYPTRFEVENANKSRLDKLEGSVQTYIAQDSAGKGSDGNPVSEKRRNNLLQKLVCQPFLSFKVGAQVMLIKNLVQGKLVNGSVGRIIKFTAAEDVTEEVESFDEKEGPKLETSRKLDRPVWPVVRFIDGTEKIVMPANFDVNNVDGEMEARRVQVPLILAWALSVHKSQGQTLERVKVDLRKTFENGQAYVALSRATTLNHLQILNFAVKKVTVDARVLKYYGVTKKVGPQPEDVMDFDDEYD